MIKRRDIVSKLHTVKDKGSLIIDKKSFKYVMSPRSYNYRK